MNIILQELAEFSTITGYEDLQESIVEETKYLLLDSIGCALTSTTMDGGNLLHQPGSGKYLGRAVQSEICLFRGRA